MSRKNRPAPTDQPDLFPEQPRLEVVDPDDVRVELLEILALAKAARDGEQPRLKRADPLHRNRPPTSCAPDPGRSGMLPNSCGSLTMALVGTMGI